MDNRGRTQVFSIQLPEGITISSQLTESEVSKIQDVLKNDKGNGYTWYCLPVIELNNKKNRISLCYQYGVLNRVIFSVDNPELYGHDWDDWNDSKEITRANETEEWLKDIGYEAGKYSWGEIWAGYEPKSASGFVSVKLLER